MVMSKNSNYNNTKKTETKWGKRSTLVHPKLYVRSFVPQMISVRVMVMVQKCLANIILKGTIFVQLVKSEAS